MPANPRFRVYTKDEFLNNRERIIHEIALGAVFVYPTDTMYCLGCDASNHLAVLRLRRLKERFHGPFSVIAPSKAWIRKWSRPHKQLDEWLEHLPGPYTLVVKEKPKAPLAKEVNFWEDDTIGIKLPRHWSSELANLLGRPIVSTTANQRGKMLMTSLATMSPQLRKGVDFVLYEGPKRGQPNTIVDLARRNAK